MEKEPMMTLKEAERYQWIQELESKNISLKGVSKKLGLSYRQTRRIRMRYRKEGVKGLVSKRRGRESPHQLPRGVKEQVLKLLKEIYADYGPTLAMEKLRDRHSLHISKETVRKLLIQEGLWQVKQRKCHQIHPRRTRRPCIGELEQIDGSYEYWFEERAEKCCLLVCVDDATSEIMALRFCKRETTEDYLIMLRDYLARHGRPEAVYSDRHSIFRVNQKEVVGHKTQFHKTLERWGIRLICARSPQAKGRVERANGVLQDRLIKELREQGISSIAEGNAYLETFRKAYNNKFGKIPGSSVNAHRELPQGLPLDDILLSCEERKVAKDLSFSFGGEIYQITHKPIIRGKKIAVYTKKGVIEYITFRGQRVEYNKWKDIAYSPKTMDSRELEALYSSRKRPQPGKHHPWR